MTTTLPNLRGFALNGEAARADRMETAVTQIAARGYYLFTGSARLLATRVSARAAAPQVSIGAAGTDASSTTR